MCPSCCFFFKDLSRHSKCSGKSRPRVGSSESSCQAEGVGDLEGEEGLVVGPTCDGVGPSPVSVTVESSSSSSAAGSSSVDKERESWALIDSLSWDDILSRCPHTVVGIKDHLKALWQQAVRVPLRALSSDISDESAWKLLFLLPSMLLMKDVQRGGKKGGGEIKRKFRRFLDFQWATLLPVQPTPKLYPEGTVIPPDCARRGLLRKVEHHICEGNISRAARLLTSSGLAPDTPDTLVRLKAKHPQPSGSIPPPVIGSEPPITLQRDVFLRALKSAPRGSAPGPSGLRFEHLKACMEVRDLSDCLLAVAQRVVTGGPGPSIGRALAAARLIALPKGDHDVRAIAVGEVFRRLVARSICLQEKATMADILSPMQYGVAVPGGLDQIVHQIQAGLEAHDDWGLFKCDLQNAFNSVSREAFFRETSCHLPSIMPFTRLLYGQPSPLIYKGSDTSSEILSCEGVHQGDPLGPFYFCVAIHPVLQSLSESHPDLLVSAFFDDVNLLGPPDQIGAAIPRLTDAFHSCGLRLHPQKCELFHSHAFDFKWAEGMRRSTAGTLLLGGAIGSSDFVSETYLEIVQRGSGLLSGVKELQSGQCAFVLLRYCANQSLTHVLRLSPPDVTARASTLHDDLISATLAHILDLDHLPEQARKQASLRISSGGLGLTSAFRLRHAAFVASWSASLQSLLDRVPSFSVELQAVVDSGSMSTSASALRNSLHCLSTSISDFSLSVDDLLHAPPRLQSKLGADLDDALQSALLQEVDQVARARLLSSSCRESGAWVSAVPLSQHHALNPEEFSSGIRMRLGLPLPLARGMSSYPNRKCSAAVDAEGQHLLMCGMGPGRVRLHDRMVRVWHSAILSTGLRATVEQRGLYPDQRRPDIVVPDFANGESLHLDFSATHPCLPSNVAASSRSAGAAAAKREREKRNLYSDCDGTFTPLVCEHHGRWGGDAVKLLKSLSCRAAESSPHISRSQFTDFWLKKLGCEFLRGCVSSMAGNAAGWHRGNYCVDELIDCIAHHITL